MTDEFEIHKLKSLTKVLSEVYTNYVNVDEAELKETSSVVKLLFKRIERALCKEDPLFARMLRKTVIISSVADDLKVFAPDECDFNMMLKLPECFAVYPSNIPGYVFLKEKCDVGDIRRIKHLPKYLKSNESSYLLPEQLRLWITTVLIKAMKHKGIYHIPEWIIGTSVHYKKNPALINANKHDYLKVCGTHLTRPGYMLRLISIKDGTTEVSMDIVPCFECDNHLLPRKYRRRISKGKCLLIPKEPNRDVPFKKRYWRLCFHDYERDMLHDRQVLKPAIKLLKALKVKLDIFPICSYHIKAICLYEMQKAGQNEFWKEPLSICFLHLLKACIWHIGNGKISAVYDNKFNLIEHFDISKCKEIASKLNSVLEKIVRNPDTRTIASYLLDEKDFLEFKRNFSFSRRYRSILREVDDDSTGVAIETQKQLFV